MGVVESWLYEMGMGRSLLNYNYLGQSGVSSTIYNKYRSVT